MERIPILHMGELLLVTVQVDMYDKLATALQDDVCQRIADTKARGVLIDISALDTVDSYIARIMGDIAQMAGVLGADTVLVGMRPTVAITLVEMGVSLLGIRTALNAERGMALLNAGALGEPSDASGQE